MLNIANTDNFILEKNNSSNRIINIENLTFSYDNSNYIFKNANLSINKGDFVCIVGKNGCGKSTLLKLMLNLIKSKNLNISIGTKNISYIPQIFNFNKDFPITVKEFLKYNTKELNTPFSNALYLCEKYDLIDNINSLIGKLSGGQLQKLMLIRSLLKKTDLLMVDEPTNNLDECSKYTIYDDLKELNICNNITIVVIEHNKDFSNNYANKVFLIKEGSIYRV
ncbi:metal ABC transporter ATP-binding protein [Candidatus Arthromitus sp. SFB-rat-Yit]|uniref:metal ABC transporter ATP-binding protein n=1 Tax=Candidatus Arthromitus sp. SFB-rat-Yit TaxID=1041504 RepID=UPI000227A265|nr:ATP-binding cassette domain-containing protein [Candidatus Arthromitus sp. SFB-rat-Yit]BAK80787.1 manganese/zinc/iron chelate uptake ABC transporter, Mzt family, ATP-binding protein [Candidatus Arthromitus sp. SFB-rat-Yit]